MKICKILAILALFFGVLATPVLAQKSSAIAGDYTGMLGPMHVKLHITAAANGTLTGTVDNPDANLFGLPCADLHLDGRALSFTVPMTHGAWTGFVANDGNSMSGIYNQGQSIPLTWTRVGMEAAGATAPSPLPVSPTPTTASASPSSCPAASMGNYWDGSSWKPLTQPVVLPSERGLSVKETLKNPLNPMASYTTIYRYRDSSSGVTLSQTPKFCFPISINQTPNVVIGELDVKKNERDIELKFSDVRNSQSGIPARKAVDVDITRTSPTTIEVTPKTPLHAGQYLVTSSYASFDFAVQ